MSDGILRGDAAALSACRVAQETALPQILADDNSETIHGPLAVTALFPGGDADSIRVPGKVVVTSKYLLFWVVGGDGDGGTQESLPSGGGASPFDIKVDAHCIDLHALTGANEDVDGDEKGNKSTPSAVYIQMSSEDSKFESSLFNNDNNDGEADDSSLFELTLEPIVTATSSEEEVEQISRQLFEAISQMISLNPIDPNDQDEPNEEGAGMFGGGSGGWITSDGFDPSSMMSVMGNTNNNNASTANDDMVVAGAEEDAPPTEEERNAMLERLDNLLIVPPELEVQEEEDDDDASDGQFDDAEDNDDDIL